MPSHFEAEIREQPGALARLLEASRAEARPAAERIRAFAPRFVVIAARGSSDNVARYAQYLFGIRHGLSVALAAPSIQTRYGASPALAGALVVGVSQSGRSPDLVTVVEDGRRQGALTLAVTNDPGAPLALAAERLGPARAQGCRGFRRRPAQSRSPASMGQRLCRQLTAIALTGRLQPNRTWCSSSLAPKSPDTTPVGPSKGLRLWLIAVSLAAVMMIGVFLLFWLGRQHGHYV